MTNKNISHHVFWTGGLDSTFNILHLLMTTKDIVQPHYIVRHETSSGTELDAMNNIRRAVLTKYPGLYSRFLPTVYTNEDLIPKSEDIDAAIEEIRRKVRVYEQYQILASYCKAFSIDKVDLTYEIDLDVPEGTIEAGSYFGNTFPFENFRNPHEKLTKLDYFRLAKEENWNPKFLKMTSFCRRPIKKVVPCGMCGPCNDAVSNGMGFRLPFRSRVRSRLIKPFRNYYRNNYHKHDKNWVFRFIRRRFEGKF